MNKRTQGEWFASHAAVFGPKGCIAVTDTDNANTETYEANARIMAAAPEMLAALKTIGGFISRNMRKNNDEEWAAYSQIIAAIVKAEGTQ
jgi:hypothetical protein